MHRITWLALLIAASLAGCASNPFETHYQGTPDARVLPEYDAGYAVPEGQIPVESVVDLPDLQDHTQKLLEQGFVPIGQSQFYGTGESVGPGARYARKPERLAPTRCWIYSTYRDTITVASPPPVPDASTVFANGTLTPRGTAAPAQPAETLTYSELRSNFTAMFFIKSYVQTGIYTMPITDAERRQLPGGRGVKVKAVVQDSPAATVGMQEGDFLVAGGRHANFRGGGLEGDGGEAIRWTRPDAGPGAGTGKDLNITVHDKTKGVDMRSQ